MTPRMLAVAWSFAGRTAQPEIWLAEAAPGQRPALLRLEGGFALDAVTDYLIEAAVGSPRLVVGLGVPFSLPDWLVRPREVASELALWETLERERMDRVTDRATPSPHLPVERLPHHMHHPSPTDDEALAAGSAQPESDSELSGSGSASTYSTEVVNLLMRLVYAGFTLWPADAPGRLVMCEVDSGAFTSHVDVDDPASREAYLQLEYPQVDDDLRRRAAGSAGAFNAAISALVMASHEGVLNSLSFAAHVRVASYRLERARIAQVASAISGARAQRIGTYLWCTLCRQTQPPEWMHDDSTCQGCAERYLGIIH